MRRFDLRSAGWMVLCVAAAGFLAPSNPGRAAETEDAVVLHVEDISAKVGEKATLVARLTFRDGYKVADSYRNRVSSLSAEDGGVEFENPVVRGVVQDDNLVFKIRVTPKQPGAHAINGLLRFGFVNSLDGDYHLDIKTLPLVAKVTGTE